MREISRLGQWACYLGNLKCLRPNLTITREMFYSKETGPLYWAEHDFNIPEEVPEPVIFQKLSDENTRQLKPLFLSIHLDGKTVSKVLVDGGASVNVMTLSTLQKIGKSINDLVPTSLRMTDFTINAHTSAGVLVAKVADRTRTDQITFFFVEGKPTYSAILGREWIHTMQCVPSTLHKKVMFWNGHQVETVEAETDPIMGVHSAAIYYSPEVYLLSMMLENTGASKECSLTMKGFEIKVKANERPGLGDKGRKVWLSVHIGRRPCCSVAWRTETASHGTTTRCPGYREVWWSIDCPSRLRVRRISRPQVFQLPKVKEEVEKLLKANFICTCRYPEWISNIVPVLKNSGKIRICINFRNLNLATPKDEHIMSIADMLVDSMARYEVLSFMDGYSGYNQIYLAEEDTHKTAFRCTGAIKIFEWIVMPFGPKNAGATYQMAMTAIFHNLIGSCMEVYIDDVVVKSRAFDHHILDLRKAFAQMRRHDLKMNPAKCAFGVQTGNFLGFLVHQKVIEVDKNKIKAVQDLGPPRNIMSYKA
ncbi:uncharacterized protein LOC127257705 [Andrographis paniculata]|uniref:uncharacterized protein LOC127257705 n=1 Tax=Andrographis paniculata TaxID=175694 RepID=UPI0021E81512|nr:uncharacterized protein LOC127257705 [Andrographis paniculata]